MESAFQNVSIMPNVVLDMSGLSCPAPLVGAKQVVDDLRPGEVLLLVSDCPGTKDDLFSWAQRTANEIIRVGKTATGKSEFLIRKGKHQRPKANVTLDIRGVICPGPVIEARKILAGMRQGEILKLVSSCPASQDEVGTWTGATGHELIETREIGHGVREFYIRKG
jgi:TusA-related sulfurtransferase